LKVSPTSGRPGTVFSVTADSCYESNVRPDASPPHPIDVVVNLTIRDRQTGVAAKHAAVPPAGSWSATLTVPPTAAVAMRPMGGGVRREFVVAKPKVLHERVPAHDHLRGTVTLKAPHGLEPRFEPAMVGLAPIVRVLLGVVERGRDQLIERAACRASLDR
jgi:hypothetical protein